MSNLFNPALFLYLNPELQAYSNVITVEQAYQFYQASSNESYLSDMSELPLTFDARVYLADQQNQVAASPLNQTIYTAMLSEGYTAKALDDIGTFVATIYQEMHLDPVAGSNRFILENSNYMLSPDNLGSNDWVKIVKNNNEIIYTKVDAIDASNYAFTVRHPTYPNYAIRDVSAKYLLMGIKLYDFERLARIHYLRFIQEAAASNPEVNVPGNITIDADFNLDLYKVLYPDARLLSKQKAYIDYLGRLNNDDSRIAYANDIFSINAKPTLQDIYDTILTNGLSLNNTLIANRNAYFNGQLIARDHALFQDAATFYHNVLFTGTEEQPAPIVRFDSKALFHNQFTTYSSATHSNGMSVHGDVLVTHAEGSGNSNEMNVYIPVNVWDTMDMHGAVTLRGALSISGDVDIYGRLFVASNVTLSNDLDVLGATALSNTLDVVGATTLINTLDVLGATTLSNTLLVTGGTSLKDTLDVLGAVSLSNALDVEGTTLLRNSLRVDGSALLQDSLSVLSNVGLCNTLDVAGTTTLHGAVTARASVTFQAPVTLSNTFEIFNTNTNTVLQHANTHGLLKNTMLVTERGKYIETWFRYVEIIEFAHLGQEQYRLVIPRTAIASLAEGVYLIIYNNIFRINTLFTDTIFTTASNDTISTATMVLQDEFFSSGHLVTDLSTGLYVDIGLLKDFFPGQTDTALTHERVFQGLELTVTSVFADANDSSILILTCSKPLFIERYTSLSGQLFTILANSVNAPSDIVSFAVLNFIAAQESVSSTGTPQIHLMVRLWSRADITSEFVESLNSPYDTWSLYLYILDYSRTDLQYNMLRAEVDYIMTASDDEYLQLGIDPRLASILPTLPFPEGYSMSELSGVQQIDLSSIYKYEVTGTFADTNYAYFRIKRSFEDIFISRDATVRIHFLGTPVRLTQILRYDNNFEVFSMVFELDEYNGEIVNLIGTYAFGQDGGFLYVGDIVKDTVWRVVNRARSGNQLTLDLKKADYTVFLEAELPTADLMPRLVYLLPMQFPYSIQITSHAVFAHRVGINTAIASEWLTVNGDISCVQAFYMHDAEDGSRYAIRYDTQQALMLSSDATFARDLITMHNDTTVDGVMTATEGISQASDRRLKQNIEPTSARQDLEKVLQLAVRTYQLIGKSGRGRRHRQRRGLIAQEARAIDPGLVGDTEGFIPYVCDWVEFNAAESALIIPAARIAAQREQLSSQEHETLRPGDGIRIRLVPDGPFVEVKVQSVRLDAKAQSWVFVIDDLRPLQLQEPRPAPTRCFLYGYRDRYLVIDQDQLMMMGINAIQALHEEIRGIKQALLLQPAPDPAQEVAVS